MPQLEIDVRELEKLDPVERGRAVEKIRRLTELMRDNPLHGYSPYKRQAEFHAAAGSYPTRAFFGGNRAGKTVCGVVDDCLEVVPEELIPSHLRRWKLSEWKCPRYIRVGNVSNREVRSIIYPQFQRWLPRQLLPKNGWKGAYNADDSMIRLECGCAIQMLSYELDRDKWGGSPLHRMHFDEEPPKHLYEEGAARLVDFNGIELFTMTPLEGMTWMFDDVWMRAQKDEDVYAVVASMVDNPHLSREGIARAVQKYAGFPEMLAARVYGRFVHFGGLVYPAWPHYRQTAYDLEGIRACDIVVGIDPGARNFGLSWNAFDGRENQIQFASELIAGDFHDTRPGEVHLEGANVEHAARKIREVNERWGLGAADVSYVIDPSARARSAITSATVETEFANFGIYVEHGQSDREAGILLLRRKGEHGAFVTLDIAGNEAAQWEAERYRVQERVDGKFDVVKENDHVMDATRYATSHRPWDAPPVADVEDLVEFYRRPENRHGDVALPPPRKGDGLHPAGQFV